MYTWMRTLTDAHAEVSCGKKSVLETFVSTEKKMPPLYVPFLIGVAVNLMFGLMNDHRYAPEEILAVSAIIAGAFSGVTAVLLFWYFSRTNRAALPFLLSLSLGFSIGANAADLWHGTPLWFTGIALIVNAVLILLGYQHFVKKTRKSDVKPPDAE